MLCRWTVLVLTPYGVVPFLTAVLTLPSVLLWKTEERDEHRDRITDTQFFGDCCWPLPWPAWHGLWGTGTDHAWRIGTVSG